MAKLLRETSCESYYDLPHWLLEALSTGNYAVRIRDDLAGVEFLEILGSDSLTHPEDILDEAIYVDLRCVRAMSQKYPRGLLMLVSACEMFPLNRSDYRFAEDLGWDVELELVDEWVYRGILTLKETLH